jgi:O-antigen/teichoic acid export membrane protein
MAFITVTALVIAKVMKVGIGQATTVFAAQRPAERRLLLSNLVTYSVAGSFVGGAIVCGLLLALPDIRPEDIDVAELGILLAGTVATSLWDEAFLLGCQRMRSLAIRMSLVGWLYALALAVAWLTVGLDVTSAAAAWAVSQAMIGVMYNLAPLREFGFARPSLRLLREMLAFGSRAWTGTLASLLNARFDQILMAFISTQATLGIYAVAVNSSELLLYLPNAIAAAMLPAMSAGDRTLGASRAMRVLRAGTVFGLVTMAASAALGPFLLPHVFGARFQPSVAPFLWLLCGVVGFTAMSVTNSALMASDAPGRSSIGPFVCLVVGVVLDLVLIPPYGASGAAVAASAAFIAGGAVGLWLYHSQVRFGWRELIPGRTDVRDISAFAARFVRAARPA